MKDSVRQSLIQRDFGLTDEQNKRLINTFEEYIITAKLELEEKMPRFQTIEATYNEAKAKIDTLIKQLEADEATLQLLSAIRTGKVSPKVLREQSHTEAKIKRKQTKTRWSIMAEEVLTEAKRFMTLRDIFTTIEVKYDEVHKLVKNNRAGYVYANFNKTMTGVIARGGFKEYKGNVGLPNWVDAAGIPQPQYIKQFMYN